MSQLIYTELRGKGGVFKQVPHEIFSQEEAAERGIEPLSRTEWRDRFFGDYEDISGKYVLTDDEPPLVAPVVKCKVLKPREPRYERHRFTKIHFPWTFLTGRRNPLKVDVEVGVVSQQLKSRYKRVTPRQRRLFLLLVTMSCDPLQAIGFIWGLDQKVDQNYFRRLLVTDPKTEEAQSRLARAIYEEAGFGPVELAKAMKAFALDEKNPARDRKEMLQDIANRQDLDDRKPEAQQQGMIGGVMIASQLGPGGESVADNVAAELAEVVEEQARRSGGNSKKVRKLISQSSGASDE